MAGIFLNNGGSWAAASAVPVNNSGAWQNAQEVWAKDNGLWVKVFPDLVREPASGDLFQRNVNEWVQPVGGERANIYWSGAIQLPNPFVNEDTVSVTIGSWTYYRGVRGDTSNPRAFRLYRIGTP